MIGRSSSGRVARCFVRGMIGYIVEIMSVSSVRPVPSARAPPLSYTTGRDGSSTLTISRASWKLRPRPASFPIDQKTIDG